MTDRPTTEPRTAAGQPCDPIVEAGSVIACKCGHKMKHGESWIVHADHREDDWHHHIAPVPGNWR